MPRTLMHQDKRRAGARRGRTSGRTRKSPPGGAASWKAKPSWSVGRRLESGRGVSPCEFESRAFRAWYEVPLARRTHRAPGGSSRETATATDSKPVGA